MAPFAVLVALFLALAIAGPAQAQTSGSDSEPQPISNADSNDGGANGQCPEGPYCSTRDGSPSENGNGDGEAKGKPCAGCVGKADNKNPQGQNPDGSDHNNGYECDGNNGIGKGNPAHTACPEGETTPPDEPGTPDEPGNPDQPGTPDEPEVAGVELEAQPNTDKTTTVAATQPARTASTVLPQTGTPDSLVMLLFAGLGMTGIGAMTLLYRRRTATSS